METKLIENGDTAEIALIGRLDTKTSRQADTLFSEVGGKFSGVTLDMTELSYISSAGIRAIRNLYMALYRKGGSLSVKNAGENVLDVFEMTGLKGLLQFV